MIATKIRIYIAGPMSGYPNLNWNAFDEKEKQLTAAGFEVVNPARMDREIGLDPQNMRFLVTIMKCKILVHMVDTMVYHLHN